MAEIFTEGEVNIVVLIQWLIGSFIVKVLQVDQRSDQRAGKLSCRDARTDLRR